MGFTRNLSRNMVLDGRYWDFKYTIAGSFKQLLRKVYAFATESSTQEKVKVTWALYMYVHPRSAK